MMLTSVVHKDSYLMCNVFVVLKKLKDLQLNEIVKEPFNVLELK